MAGVVLASYVWGREKFLTEFSATLASMTQTVAKKNADYSAPDDAFANFRLIEELTEGRISMEDGILVRMTDKLVRGVHLAARDPQVAGEALTDTALDLAVYSIILNLCRRSRTDMDELAGPQDTPAPTKSGMERLREFLGAHPEQTNNLKTLAAAQGMQLPL